MTRSAEDEERFTEIVRMLEAFAHLAPTHEAMKFVAAELEKADAFGPITDPTAWRKSEKDREALAVLVRHALPFCAAAENFVQTAAAELRARRAAGLTP